jgi:hypothetical protein
MFKVLQEVTVWEDDTPNHTYFVNATAEHVFAYINVLNGQFVFFKRSMQFCKSRRKFKTLSGYNNELA